MLSKLNHLIDECSRTGWKFLIVFVGFGGTLASLQRITGAFPDVADGNIPFDMQNTLESAQVFAQLNVWSDAAFDLYTLFQVIDYFFPLFGGLMMGAVFAFSLRTLAPGLYETARTRNWFLIFMVPTLCDWLENIGFLGVIAAWPEQSTLFATLAITAKYGKLGSLMVTQPVALIMLVVALLKRLVGLVRRAPEQE